jgi:hypothetical protein
MPSPLTIIEYAGAALVVVVLAYAAMLTISAASRLRHQRAQRQKALDLLAERVQAARQLRVAREELAHSWKGVRKFEVSRKVDEGGGITSFYLAPHDRKKLPAFQPGQFLTFELDIPGPGKRTVRCYSLSDSPGKEYYRVSIKKIAPCPEKPSGGLSSCYFHDKIEVGDILDVKAPGGHFYLDMTRESPIVLIGGGVGLTPVLSMLNAVAESGSPRQTWFFYGVRNGAEHIMADHLRTIAREHEHVRLHVCYSQPAPGDQAQRDYHWPERVSVDLLKRVLPSSNFDFYICGPPAMMESLVPGLKEWGVPKERIHFEAFGPASVKSTPAPAPLEAASASGIAVEFSKSGKKAQWTERFASLLDLAEAHGVAIDFGCRAGNCGTCKTAIKSGEVQYTNDPGETPEEGSCLACVSVPKGPLVLNA